MVVLTFLYRYDGLQKPYTYVKILYICKTKQHRVVIDVFVKTQNLMSLREKRDFRLTWQSAEK